MNIKEATKLLEEEYERAQKMCFVRNPLAWALYRVWKKADGQKDWDKDCIRDCKNCWKKIVNSHDKAVPKWIPVSEKLPETKTENLEGTSYEMSGYVLGIDENKEVQKVKRECREYFEGWSDEPGTLYCITHWMPLPSPPEETP